MYSSEGRHAHIFCTPQGYVFAFVHIVCVCWHVFKDECSLSLSLSLSHAHSHKHTHTLHHGQTTCLSRGSFHEAVCPAGSDSIWKTCLNESTHQLHQRVLTSLASLPRLTLLSLCPRLSHNSLFITSLPFYFCLFSDHSTVCFCLSRFPALLFFLRDYDEG